MTQKTKKSRFHLKPWAVLLVVCVFLFSLHEAFWIQMASHSFTAGFNVDTLEGPADYILFSILSAFADASIILLCWALLRMGADFLRLLFSVRTKDRHLLFFAVAAVVIVSVVTNLVKFRIITVLGGMLDWKGSQYLSGQNLGEIVDLAASHLRAALWPVSIPIGLLIVFFHFRSMIVRRFGFSNVTWSFPSLSGLIGGALFTGVVVCCSLLALHGRDSAVRSILSQKASFQAIRGSAAFATDFDRDGTNSFSNPIDFAPFNPDLNPFALEIPNNGSDEDGIGGDLTFDFARTQVVQEELTELHNKPHFLLIYLESFRADLLHKRFNGIPITPFMNRLADEGNYSENAYVNSPFTVPSRGQLFGGTITPSSGQATMIDDFKKWGYHVAYFSGQDDSHSQSESFIGLEHTDHFYDARQDKNRRISRSTRSVSLQVSWKLVNDRVFSHLDGLTHDAPLFLYVNFTDTHYPYHHIEIDNILGVDPVMRGDIRRDRVDEVFATYANTSANVDRAIEKLVGRWLEYVGDDPYVILITSDHGEAFYENGVLGHGRSLQASETRIPLILVRFVGDWPEPIAPSDLRGLVRRHLSSSGTANSKVRFVPSDREILHYIGSFSKPSILGLRNIDGCLEYGFQTTGKYVYHSSSNQNDDHATKREHVEMFRRLVHNWEALRLEGR